MTFHDLDQIVGQLPPSARTHREFWANSGHAHARAWTEAGWVASTADWDAGAVTFRRRPLTVREAALPEASGYGADQAVLGTASAGSGTKRQVFLVHGRNLRVRRALVELLRAFDLRVIGWEQAAAATGHATPYTGDVVAAGIDMADAVVVLLTPDDVGSVSPEFQLPDDRREELEPTGQPRLNVVFEAGMAMALDRAKVVLVEIGSVRPMSDTVGLNVVRLTDDPARRRQLGNRLRTAGLAVDLDHDDWRTAGTFASPPTGVPGPGEQSAHLSDEIGVEPRRDGESFLRVAEQRCSPTEMRLVERLLADVRERGTFVTWSSGTSPAATGWYKLGGRPTGVWMLDLNSRGAAARAYLAFTLTHVGEFAGEDRRDWAARVLEEIPDLTTKVEAARASGWKKHPTVQLGAVAFDDNSVRKILDAIGILIG